MKKDNPIWIFAVIVAFILLVLNVVFSMKITETQESLVELRTDVPANFSKTSLQGECPDSVGGHENAYLQIKYFYSDFCLWCRKEEPILQRLVADYGGLFNISWINTNSCPKDADKYKISGVPTFVFSSSDALKEYSHYGFIHEKDLKKLVCDVTGGC